MELPEELTNRPPRAPGHAPSATLTLDAYRRLKEELDDLKGRGRIDIAEKIRVAREHGDLRENADYDAAKAAGLPTVTMLARDFPSRDAFDQAVAGTLVQHGVSLVCLAGFMRLVGAPLLEAFPNRILNIHPSLLPAFPGLDAQQQALDYGVA